MKKTESSFIELSHTLNEKVPTWGGKQGFHLETKLDYHECTPPATLRVQQVKMHAGIGTHIDAPAHFVQGGRTVDYLAFDELLSIPLFVVDVSEHAGDNPDYLISQEDVLRAEQLHGEIPTAALVAFYTGWSKHWSDQDKYRNENSAGVMQFPAIKSEVIDYILTKNIVGIGIDVLSPDDPLDNTFPVHVKMLGADKYIVENMANLDKVACSGMRCSVVPLNIKDATEAPVRLFCEVDKK